MTSASSTLWAHVVAKDQSCRSLGTVTLSQVVEGVDQLRSETRRSAGPECAAERAARRSALSRASALRVGAIDANG